MGEGVISPAGGSDSVSSATDGRPPRPRAVVHCGAEFDGLLVIQGEVRVDGRVRGEILGAAVLEIGETGEVEASIEADEVLVAGSFRGEIRAHRRVELRATARVRGSIETPRLVLEEGSLLDGRCRAGSAPSDALAAAGKPSETRGSSS